MATRITRRGWLFLARSLSLSNQAAIVRARQCHSPLHDLLRAQFSTTRTVASNGGGDQPNNNFAAVATGGYEYPGIPRFEDPYAKRKWQLEHMAGAFRVFARMGFTEGASGHISVRDPVDRETFWINPMGVHFGLLTASDMVHIDEHGQVIGGNRTAVNAAGFRIHSAVHRARPDVDAACHMHSKHGKAWSAFGRPLDIINQDACRFWRNHGVHTEYGGVALADDEGVRIAASLGPSHRAVILQNHGLLTAGGTVDEAAYLYTLMERTCEIQLLVEAAGLEKRLIGDEEAAYTYKYEADPETLYTEFQPDFQYEVAMANGQLYGGTDFGKREPHYTR
ncbi:aldolase [Cordyceps fumosorosea ARSEF 2679]|uniref:Aldolase n=1 Tax=Cordyceps fumosorosea (strain ARSEF 2679) TaxID=1081104 RepID=A0A167V2A0_CORFA|nr:aldolase [Cordyceps fumosorosea ARSEF 2679]OAA62151.1 aldolase [Cordyceps fumosorosea ARSEF 2679]